MALRAFRSNPSLGGFGSESGVVLLTTRNDVQGSLLRRTSKRGSSSMPVVENDCDAVAQIVKELVDNAIDSTRTLNHHHQHGNRTNKRVRVIIEQCEAPRQLDNTCQSESTDGDESEERDEPCKVLRVTVSDNGCGMEDIQACVEAFRGTKSQSELCGSDKMTAGRYGVGLTLCLLHAQRLVPNSCASITSATSKATHFTNASYVVDTEGDSVRCVRREKTPKSYPEESGTSVSVLVPGGVTAMYAWPRLAEYFARFQLIVDLSCSLEVKAPTLSRLPLFVQPFRNKRGASEWSKGQPTLDSVEIPTSHDDKNEMSISWTDGFIEDKVAATNTAPCPNHPKNTNKKTTSSAESSRKAILEGARAYLKLPVDIKNVALSCQPIRVQDSTKVGGPTLEVAIIVYGSAEECNSIEIPGNSSSIDRSARMILVRMVNKVPLLDGAEALACGLVQGITSKQSLWNSFGLEVTTMTRDSSRKSSTGIGETADEDFLDPTNFFVPTFRVLDSEQVAPFFQTGSHQLFDDNDNQDLSEEEDHDEEFVGRRKQGGSKRPFLLPAHVRLGNLLIMVNIQAKPACLPLPTLSKGRLPLNNLSIDKALEVGLSACLRSLQQTNPGLLLTAQQLRVTERDVRYIPAASAAIASVVCKSQRSDWRRSVQRQLQNWSVSTRNDSRSSQECSQATDSSSSINSTTLLDVTTLGPIIEKRLKLLCAEDALKKKVKRVSKRGRKVVESESEHQESQYEDEHKFCLFNDEENIKAAATTTVKRNVVSPLPPEEISQAWEDSW